MLVLEQMTVNPVTIPSQMPVPEALALMREKKIRRLPVVDSHGKLVGIVSEKDLLYASPSPTTSLSVFEIPYLLSKIFVEKVMTKEVVTVSDDTPLESAALLMADRKIGGLPVMKGDKLVGIITETDMFRAFLNLLGGRRRGVRVTASTSGVPGTIAKVANAVFQAGGDIVGLGQTDTTTRGEPSWEITLKVQGVPKDKLIDALKPMVREIKDVRED